MRKLSCIRAYLTPSNASMQSLFAALLTRKASAKMDYLRATIPLFVAILITIAIARCVILVLCPF